MDLIEHYHVFSKGVAKALNDAKLEPVDTDGFASAVLLVVHPKNQDESPIGGSLNYHADTKTWKPSFQLDQPERYTGEN